MSRIFQTGERVAYTTDGANANAPEECRWYVGEVLRSFPTVADVKILPAQGMIPKQLTLEQDELRPLTEEQQKLPVGTVLSANSQWEGK